MTVRYSRNALIDERCRKVMRLRLVQKWSIDQIARALGVGEKTVRRDLERIRAKMIEHAERNMRKSVEETYAAAEAAHEDRMQRLYQELASVKAGPAVVTDPKSGEARVVAYVTEAEAAKARAAILKAIREEERSWQEFCQSIGVMHKEPERRQEVPATETWEERVRRLRAERAALAAGRSPEADEDDGATEEA